MVRGKGRERRGDGMKTITSLAEIGAVRAYLQRINAEPRTFRTAVVKQDLGKYWYDKAIIRFSPDGKVTAPTDYEPTPDEAAKIKLEFDAVEFPESIVVPADVSIPDFIAEQKPFEFRNLNDELVMLQIRKDRGNGEKSYLPYTYWSDKTWRCAEPEGKLPLYNLPAARDHSVIFLHEGAKAAAAAARVEMSHPWYDQLTDAAHLGWIGGALNPGRTDFAALQKLNIKRAYIVVDNDWAGHSVTPAISQQLRCPTFSIEFNNLWPVGFDLADDFPEDLFKSDGKRRYYIGPKFRECLHPATWMTDAVPPAPGSKKITYQLREVARQVWAYVEEADMIICREIPSIMHPEPIANKVLAPYSHVRGTSALIIKEQLGRTVNLAYRPDKKELLITSKQSSAINLHVPTDIQSMKGDVTPFKEFLEYLVISPEEREIVKKWVATLIAKPEIRMGWGLLMVSEAQGVGKTTLGEQILAPLVGLSNVSFPSERDILSAFNEWIAQKRLAIIGEIYAGTSWKCYNNLKTAITDKYIAINKKYIPQYVVENWCHVYACSNSLRALKMDEGDRRWYYPYLTDEPWPSTKFVELRQWLELGGLSRIKHWAEGFGEYIAPNEIAPMTLRKRELIDDSVSEAQKEAVGMAATMSKLDFPAVVVLRDVKSWIRQKLGERVYDTDLELKRAMLNVEGCFTLKERLRFDGILQAVILNAKGHSLIKDVVDKGEFRKLIRKWRTKPTSFMAETESF